MKVQSNAYRARLGLTQVRAAFLSDCTLETYQRLERGNVEGMRVETVIRIASALGVGRPRLLSDNGPAYLSGELRDYLGERGMGHIRGAPYHPQTQGKIERYHRTMKNVVKLQHYYFPEELKATLKDLVAYDNNERYHESLDNVTPADVYFGRRYEVLTERSKIKRRTMERRKKEYLAQKAA
ncbi:MAG: DDE-type integrase/transposase/recombinase [bacterium]|nr:DDE-type integrase/transposase/recombinase [bacterium]